MKDEYIQILMDFGLSSLQASTYLTLVRLKKSDVRTIARGSNVARQDIYRIMPSLQKLGLVEKILGKPTLYRATPLEKAVSLLLEYKKEAYDLLLTKQKLLTENFPKNIETNQIDAESQFVITSELSLLIEQHEKMMRESRDTIDIMVPITTSPKIGEEWSNIQEILKNKTVKLRLIANIPTTRESNFLFWESLMKKATVDVKYIKGPIEFGMHIFDKQQMTMSIHPKEILPSLWSNNANLLRFATTYYDMVWKMGVLG